MTVQDINISLIKPYKNNAKRHTDTQIANVAESIRQFGWAQPIVVDRDYTIIIGHCRYSAAERLGLTTVPVVVAADLTDEQVRKLRNLDNKLNESEWDLDLLKDDILGLDFDGFDIDWGIEEEVITDIVEDDAPEVDEQNEPITHLGDIWQLGEHRLMCGDSTDALNINILMDGKTADMIFTDPPYGYEYQSNMRTKSKKFDVLKNDDKILEFMPAIKDICKGFIFICTTWKVLDKWLSLFNKYYDLTNMIIWNKGGGGDWRP